MLLGLPDIEGAFCGAPCTVNEDCPPGPEGTDPLCALTGPGSMSMEPEYCALLCDPLADSCPEGSSCQPYPSNPDAGVCTYPW